MRKLRLNQDAALGEGTRAKGQVLAAFSCAYSTLVRLALERPEELDDAEDIRLAPGVTVRELRTALRNEQLLTVDDDEDPAPEATDAAPEAQPEAEASGPQDAGDDAQDANDEVLAGVVTVEDSPAPEAAPEEPQASDETPTDAPGADDAATVVPSAITVEETDAPSAEETPTDAPVADNAATVVTSAVTVEETAAASATIYKERPLADLAVPQSSKDVLAKAGCATVGDVERLAIDGQLGKILRPKAAAQAVIAAIVALKKA